jgi:glycosyltransferase involved in cell wall biosynthesis
MVHQPTNGGVGRHVTDLFEGLRRRGYEVVLCGPALPSTAAPDSPHRPLGFDRAPAPRADLASLAGFDRIVRAVRPDLIHAHSSKAGAIARIAKILHPRVPVLYSPHGYAFAGYFERAVERSLYREAERSLARFAVRVITVCNAEARLAATVGPAERVRVVHNGVDPVADGPSHPRMSELAAGGPVVCTLTGLRRGKGVDTLIDALPPVLACHPQVRVAIVGDGPDRESLNARAKARAVDHAVRFLGSSSDPIGMLRGADVFVLPSSADAFPYAILEAMSVGRPIISTDVGGIPEAIVNQESGLLVSAGNPHAITRSLLELLDDPSLRARLGGAARKRVAQRFSRPAMIEGIARVYEEALDAAPRKPRRS